MYTPDSLLQLATDREAQLQPQRCGQYNIGNYDLRMKAERVMQVAQYMEPRGIAEARSIGPFHEAGPEHGQRVRLKAGARRFSTNPKVPREGEVIPRPYTITVHDTHGGYIYPERDREHGTDITVVNAKVNWVGTGSYWYWVDLNDIEVLDRGGGTAS